MFAQTVLLYPALLALLALGAGLLVERASAVALPPALLPMLGAAALVALSQLCTYVAAIAPATPYVLAAAACAGFALGGKALRAHAQAAWRERAWWMAALPLSCYALALAPVLVSGRPSFSSYLALADSAVHMAGADYLVHHGQSYAHLDLRNSYGLVINAYYNSSYPSGADTLFGGSGACGAARGRRACAPPEPAPGARSGARRMCCCDRRRAAHMARLQGLGARGRNHRRELQPRQPAHAAALGAGVRRVAARQLQTAAQRSRAAAQLRADRARAGRGRARRPRPLASRPASAGGVAVADAARARGARHLRHDVGGREGPHDHLADRRAERVGR